MRRTFIVTCAFVYITALSAAATGSEEKIRTGDGLISSVLLKCADMDCVKNQVLNYLDTLLGLDSDARNIKNVDTAIYKRIARVFKTHEFRFRLPEMIFDGSEIVYSPRTGLDIATTGTESRGLLLKKKLLLPVLLLLKLKMKVLMPIFVALIGIKALKALILSKLAIAIVIGFVAYQLLKKGGMPMPMSMMPFEPPPTAYGAPVMAPMSSTPSSYEPGWEPSSQGGPYSRVWNMGSDSAQSVAYSAYYPGAVSSSSTIRTNI